MSDTNTLPAKERQQNLSEQFLEPFHRLRGEVDRMFDEFPSRWPALSLPTRLGAAMQMPVPAIEMTEKPDAYRISVEVPGIEPETIDLQVEKDMLVLKGEKRHEREEQEEDYAMSERSYGAFERRIALPADAVIGGIEAKSRHGVLKITVPRNKEQVSEKRRIEIKSAKKD